MNKCYMQWPRVTLITCRIPACVGTGLGLDPRLRGGDVRRCRGKRIFSSDTKQILTWRLAVLVSDMNSRQRKTLEAIFSKRIPKTLPWDDIESLLKAAGCELEEQKGSAVIFDKDGEVLHAHRPHPQKEVFPYVIKEVRAFLERIGEKP